MSSTSTLYRIVSKQDNGRFKTIETTDLSGYEITGTHSSPSTRAELQGQPIIRGFLGPMYDGNAIRYECKASYEALSK